MRFLTSFTALIAVTLHAAMAQEPAAPKELAPEARQQVDAATENYYRCISDRISMKLRQPGIDARAAANEILGACQGELAPIRATLDAEKVMPEISERYLTVTRARAAHKLLEILMFTQAAQQSGNAERSGR